MKTVASLLIILLVLVMLGVISLTDGLKLS
jgi:hypothetical protein